MDDETNAQIKLLLRGMDELTRVVDKRLIVMSVEMEGMKEVVRELRSQVAVLTANATYLQRELARLQDGGGNPNVIQ